MQLNHERLPANMKVKKTSSKLIKPTTPTPPNLKIYKISFTDKNQPPAKLAVVLFYQSKPQSDSHLEESLSKTLVHFYPLAGRFIKEHHFIDCSDQGAEFIEAEAPSLHLASVIQTQQLTDFSPDCVNQADETASQPLLSIQATYFASGGMAIAIAVSHRVFDVSSLATFIAAWSNIASSGQTTITPSFDIASHLPSEGHTFFDIAQWEEISFAEEEEEKQTFVVKKLIFDGTTLARLRSKIARPASAARLASAAIAEALIRLDRRERGRGRGFRIFQPVNMRERTVSPLAKHSFGNFSFMSFTQRVDVDGEGVSICEIVELMGEAVRRCIDDHAEIVSPNRDTDGRDIIMNNLGKIVEATFDQDSISIWFTDWSKFGFYETDFGWGKPVSTSNGSQSFLNYRITLMRNREGDGIEAWLVLNQSSMHCFEQDREFWDQVN